jgi:hypothetical protein
VQGVVHRHSSLALLDLVLRRVLRCCQLEQPG